MKKIILVLITVLFCQNVDSQSILTPNQVLYGRNFLFNIKNHVFFHGDSNDSYVILKMDNYSQKELFTKMLLALNDLYTDVDKVVTKIEPEAITINKKHVFKEEKVIIIDKKYYQSDAFEYRLSFKFKDGKIRIDAPVVNSIDYYPFEKKALKKKGDMKSFSDGIFNAGLELEIQDIYKRIIRQIDEKQNNDW